MLRLSMLFVALLLCAFALPAASWMMTERITGEYHPYSLTLGYDRALAALGNSPGRVYATRVSFAEASTTESLYFAGDVKSFNAFLENYSKLKYTKLVLTVKNEDTKNRPIVRVRKPGSGSDGKPDEYDDIRYDWVLTHYLPGVHNGEETVRLEVWVGKILWDKVRLPKNVEVKFDKTTKPSGSAQSTEPLNR